MKHSILPYFILICFMGVLYTLVTSSILSSDKLLNLKQEELLYKYSSLKKAYWEVMFEGHKYYNRPISTLEILNECDCNTNILIYILPSNLCNDCLIAEIEVLQILADSIGKERILILTNFNTEREMDAFASAYKIDIKIVNDSSNKQLFNLFDKSYFIYIKKCIIQNIFVPLTDNEDLLYEYLILMVQHYKLTNYN